MVLSAQFWPTFREEKVTLPEQLQKSLDAYTERYKVLKGNRTLCWKPHLGKVLKGNMTLCWNPHLVKVLKDNNTLCWKPHGVTWLSFGSHTSKGPKRQYDSSVGTLLKSSISVSYFLKSTAYLVYVKVIIAKL